MQAAAGLIMTDDIRAKYRADLEFATNYLRTDLRALLVLRSQIGMSERRLVCFGRNS